MPPSANDEIPDFFDDDGTIAQQLQGDSPPDEGFAFAASVPQPKSKKKKGKKNVKTARKTGRLRTQEDEGGYGAEGDDQYGMSTNSPYVPSATPSPPKDDGVKLGEDLSREEDATDQVEENGFFDEPIEPDPIPQPVPVPKAAPPPSPSPPVRSPRLEQAKPVQAAARTPPRPPASLYSPPQQPSSVASYRPNKSSAHPPPPAVRRESATHTSPRPRLVEPVAPPHKPQPHFYGLPDFGLKLNQQQTSLPSNTSIGKLAGSESYCCTFDSFSSSGDTASAKKAKDALLVGSEGGLELFRVLSGKFEVVGRLEGLRGSVVGAKVLPAVGGEGEGVRGLRPLVAVVVHGATDGEIGADGEGDMPGCYQTSVEVYSLLEQTRVAVLYRSAPVAVGKPTLGHLASIPGPVGDLRVAAEGRYVTVASGKSGEVFVFSDAATAENPDERFRCLGKFWTALQKSTGAGVSRPQSSSEGVQGADEGGERPGVPLLSLSQRWLALVALSTSSHVSVGGSPHLLDGSAMPPGIASHVAPPQPPISCDIAGVDSEGTWSRVTRQAAQGLVKYSQLGFEMGRQGWRELTNPALQAGGQHSRGASREHDAFPPTMAPVDDPSRLTKEPAIVSIIDLDTLLEAEELKPKYPPAPLATFALQEGCNFLSFSTSGLRLLSVSRSGKISTIWDLTQSCHGTSTAHNPSSINADEDAAAQGPCVKQIHRFDRNSEALVLNAAWSRDDDMLALLTSHGTVHLHEVPYKPPSSRKRKRRSTPTSLPPAAAAEKAQATVGVSSGASPPSTTSTTNSGRWFGGLRSGFQQVSSQVNNTVRSSQPAFALPRNFAGIRDLTTQASSASGRAIATGLRQGYTAAKGGVGDYWHAEDNKIRLPGLGEGGGDGVLHWVRRQSGSELAVVCKGVVWLHSVQLVSRRKGDVVVTGLRHERAGRKNFTLPLIRTSSDLSSGQAGKRDACAEQGPHGFWSLRFSPGVDPGVRQAPSSSEREQQANEVETNPPYCPFHVDPRVNVYTFDDEDTLFHSLGHGLEDEPPWLFGCPLPPSTKMNTHDTELPPFNTDGGARGLEDSDDELVAQVESRLTIKGDDEVRVHTRPRRGGGDEFDEFEGLGDDGDLM